MADGYARNLLIPTGQAQQASCRGGEAQAALMKKSWQVRNAKEREAAEEVAKLLVATTIEIPARAGAEGKLFGSVTSADVTAAIQAQSGVELDRKHGPVGRTHSLGRHPRGDGQGPHGSSVPGQHLGCRSVENEASTANTCG